MKDLIYITLFFLTVSTSIKGQVSNNIQIKGELEKWHTITFLLKGPLCSETVFRPNPFLDYRLEVTFSNVNKQYKIPGFFAAYGQSSETEAISGNNC